MSDTEASEKKSRGRPKKVEPEKAPAPQKRKPASEDSNGEEPATKKSRGRPKGSTKKKSKSSAASKKRGRKSKPAQKEKEDSASE